MKIENLPKKYEKIWKKALPILKNGRPGDDIHAREVAQLILNYKGKIKFDKDVLVPVGMMHDIGHAAILPEHFKHITGPNKIANGKLVHMLAGAKIADDILASVGYDKKKTKEIVDIISIHDFDQIKDVDWKKVYETTNKKVFHDIDALDRYTEQRIKSMSFMYEREDLLKLLEEFMDLLFYPEFRKIAEEEMKILRKVK